MISEYEIWLDLTKDDRMLTHPGERVFQLKRTYGKAEYVTKYLREKNNEKRDEYYVRRYEMIGSLEYSEISGWNWLAGKRFAEGDSVA